MYFVNVDKNGVVMLAGETSLGAVTKSLTMLLDDGGKVTLQKKDGEKIIVFGSSELFDDSDILNRLL